MTKARDVYESFKTHKDRQEQILASVRHELTETRGELEAASAALPHVVAAQFPRLTDLPLKILTAASHLPGAGGKRDYKHMVEALQAQGRRNRAEYAETVKAYGTKEEIEGQLVKLRGELDAQGTKGQKAKESSDVVDMMARENAARRFPLTQHQAGYGVTLTDSDLPGYRKFSLGKWMFNPEWRSAHRAVKLYTAHGGRSIADDLAAHDQYIAEGKVFAVEAKNAAGAHARAYAAVKKFEGAKTRLGELNRDYMDDTKIHEAVVASTAEMLRVEEVAKFLGAKLPKERAKPLLVASLALRNLGIIHDNLDTLEANAKKAVEKLEKPTSQLKKLAKAQPSKSLHVDLKDLDAQLGTFNTAATAYVQKAVQSRKVLNRFASSAPTVSNPVVINHYHDDTFSLTNYMLWQMMLSSDTNAASAASGPDMSAHHFSSAAGSLTTPSFDNSSSSFSLPDVGGSLGSSLPNFDAGSFSIPSLDFGSTLGATDFGTGTSSTPSFDFGSSSSSTSFDFSSSSSSSSAGGGSSFDSGSSFSSSDSGSSFSGGDSGGGWITIADRPSKFSRRRRHTFALNE